jgi:hypothetical protein
MRQTFEVASGARKLNRVGNPDGNAGREINTILSERGTCLSAGLQSEIADVVQIVAGRFLKAQQAKSASC